MIAPLVLLVMGLGLMWLAARLRQIDRIPKGRLVLVDEGDFSRFNETLYDRKWGLAGCPDYVVARRKGLVPVEVKSGEAPSQPYRGHLLQLAAYCHLLEAARGRRPGFGVIRYQNGSFRVPYSSKLRQQLRETLSVMHDTEGMPDRSHNSATRCQRCGYASACNQHLSS